jgi:hypothetical protein
VKHTADCLYQPLLACIRCIRCHQQKRPSRALLFATLAPANPPTQDQLSPDSPPPTGALRPPVAAATTDRPDDWALTQSGLTGRLVQKSGDDACWHTRVAHAAHSVHATRPAHGRAVVVRSTSVTFHTLSMEGATVEPQEHSPRLRCARLVPQTAAHSGSSCS